MRCSDMACKSIINTWRSQNKKYDTFLSITFVSMSLYDRTGEFKREANGDVVRKLVELEGAYV